MCVTMDLKHISFTHGFDRCMLSSLLLFHVESYNWIGLDKRMGSAFLGNFLDGGKYSFRSVTRIGVLGYCGILRKQ